VPSTHSYWFRSKLHGWGWGLPTAWQGWMTLVLWGAAQFEGLALLRHNGYHLAHRLVFILFMGVVLTLVCYWKGEPQSGDPSKGVGGGPTIGGGGREAWSAWRRGR